MILIKVKTAELLLAKHLLLFDFNIVILVVLGKVCFTGIFRVWHNRRRNRLRLQFKKNAIYSTCDQFSILYQEIFMQLFL